ncbi:MAG: Rpp14/Pop5 family protein [Nitrososphaeraceae archaeon]
MTFKRRNKRRYIILSYDEKAIERYYFNSKKINNYTAYNNSLNNQSSTSLFEISKKRIFAFDNSTNNLNNNISTENNNIINANNKNFNFYYYTIIKIIKKRYSEIFGFIESERANIHVIVIKKIIIPKNAMVIRCDLDSLDKLLFITSISNPEITTLKISGTIKKLIVFLNS